MIRVDGGSTSYEERAPARTVRPAGPRQITALTDVRDRLSGFPDRVNGGRDADPIGSGPERGVHRTGRNGP
ncbi:hypothetical protein Airi02_055110 [Actinoallomurus iriomotensis]|uniref:Uncharacterized protein n=1 Tax=Actinoallomurus iriomotensis TaxID=478107 RepID=A0A9W6S8D5_9ACTN|nr:hypothetical protein Airi02_055110 [Actinoallomurus iriomotensis]